MNRACLVAWGLFVALETGCPVGGDAGVLHQSLLKDQINRLARGRCRPADVEALCGLDDYDDCMEVCWQEMEKRGWK